MIMKTKKVKPILIESKSKSCKGDLVIVTQKLGIHIVNTEPSYHNKQELVLISLEDEVIRINEEYYSTIHKKIFKCIHDEQYFESEFKVIARQSQLSPELIQQLIDEYNNGGMKDFEIECGGNYEEFLNFCGESGYDYDGSFGWYKRIDPGGCRPNTSTLEDLFSKQPKLTNGFVTVVKKPIYQQIIDDCGGEEAFSKLVGITKEPILYTEEEVKNILVEYSKSLFRHSIELTPIRWFRENKKK